MKEFTTIYVPSKALNKTMKVFVMLPRSYDKSGRSYPVLYMHDGQNLFDEKLSYAGETWGVSEAYDENLELPEIIIVGIETVDDFRSDVLVPYKFNFKKLGFSEFGDRDYGGLTDRYLDFITKELKVLIDQKYRTYKSAKNTGIMGSSFGGVCSTYAATKYQDYFSRFGCVSNAYYVIQQQLEEAVRNCNVEGIKKLYIDTGTNETSRATDQQNYIDSNQVIYDLFAGKMEPEKIQFRLVDKAKHNEAAWRKRFPEIIQFLFNN